MPFFRKGTRAGQLKATAVCWIERGPEESIRGICSLAAFENWAGWIPALLRYLNHGTERELRLSLIEIREARKRD